MGVLDVPAPPAHRPARPAPWPDSPSAKPRARAPRIPPPALVQPMRSGVVIRHVITCLRPLPQLSLGSEKMAKVSELYDVTWEGNDRRSGRGKTRSPGNGCRTPGALGELSSLLSEPAEWRWRPGRRWRLTCTLARPPTGVGGSPPLVFSERQNQFRGPGQLLF